ncbi:hypothetical protein LLEC1_00190 [Akanthomyces lecanii]|uniref:Uncharacterized protein n=1 Tax=Cordyceps confragosa TaxID=2714763 RepID=A0A179IJJ9_CORDF|nr:hypothetical protein LLEC1_00190 [Akanthomyces lecanii]
MSCEGGCFSMPFGQWQGVDHELASDPGTTYYFCPMHRFNAAQPLCGECAAVFYHRSPVAV